MEIKMKHKKDVADVIMHIAAFGDTDDPSTAEILEGLQEYVKSQKWDVIHNKLLGVDVPYFEIEGIDAGFAYLDVKNGRKELSSRVENGEKISIEMTGYLNALSSGDDGESIEFETVVEDCNIIE